MPQRYHSVHIRIAFSCNTLFDIPFQINTGIHTVFPLSCESRSIGVPHTVQHITFTYVYMSNFDRNVLCCIQKRANCNTADIPLNDRDSSIFKFLDYLPMCCLLRI